MIYTEWENMGSKSSKGAAIGTSNGIRFRFSWLRPGLFCILYWLVRTNALWI